MNWRGRSYDLLLNPPLRGPRRWIARQVSRNELFPNLDICCGTGAQSGIMARGGGFAVGLDLDFKILRYAGARQPDVPFICADAVSLPFRARSFKSIVITFALHDKSPMARKKMIDEARRVLIPGGRVIILDFEKLRSNRSRIGNFFIAGIERMAGKEHYTNGRMFLGKGGLQVFLDEQGLRVLERREIALASSSIAVTVFARRLPPTFN